MTPAGDPFDTVTMARVLARQGRWRRAAAIYRRLLARDPRNAELAASLAEAEGAAAGGAEDDLATLIGRWVDLSGSRRRLLRLARLQRPKP